MSNDMIQICGELPVESYVKVHNQSKAMDIIRSEHNAALLRKQGWNLEKLPSEKERTFLLIDRRLVEVCYERYNQSCVWSIRDEGIEPFVATKWFYGDGTDE
jgi:hypothetical protein